MSREVPLPKQSKRGSTRALAASRVQLGSVFLGVLLCGCGSHAAGAERTRGPAQAAQSSRKNRHIPSVTGRESLRFTLKLDPALTRLDVEICPSGFAIEDLTAPSPNAQTLLESGKIITPEGDVSVPAEDVDLRHLKAGECVRYAVLFPEQSLDPTAYRRAGADLLASPDVWLWVPTPRPVGVRMHAHFALPAGVSAALPWAEEGSGAGTHTDFEISETAFTWKSAGAFTHSAPVPVPMAGARIDLAVLGAGFGEHDAEVRAWLEQGARTSGLLFGGFPLQRAQVIVVPTGRSRPAFGTALRGGGPAVVILLDHHVTPEALHDDWTCTHEFLHLGLPRLPPEDAWLFEGLATYYTELTRARAGVISPREAAQHLLEGFARGRAAAGKHTLRSDSREMRERHAFFRVYWSGAALALLTDVAARRAGGTTLDSALRSFAECCAASTQEWTAERVLAQLDAALGAPRFTRIEKIWLDRTDFPDVTRTLRALGIAPGADGQAIFSSAPDAALRDALFAPESKTHTDGQPHQPH
ncbi:MAG: hypothetical protein ABJB12_21455 [Pseudomonadota bacterium]